ncbi:histone deacetylase family protein [Phycisphaerales bacterium AB-hyl4]|uniref:Histone deacetylase family protein n=1 Tax=Natronomicrosphaera hydrolytica TaxID=3242702 RepID=A0ABV4TZU3_9BACT
MRTGLIYSERFLQHDTGPGHPERPDRLLAIHNQLQARGLLDALAPLPFGLADRRWLELVHTPTYVERVFAACEAGEPYIDSADSTTCPQSAEIAQLAAGGAITAVDAVMAGELHNAFCAMRPPGHHAEANLSMGFCLFNHVAIAAAYLIRRHGLQRVAIVDFDVHHGNGTQHLFERRSDVLFISMHQDPRHLYPGTGHAHETGRDAGEGYTLNVPLPPDSGDDVYLNALRSKVLPKLEAFDPQFLLLSAGFDASARDPLAHMLMTPKGFGQLTRELRAVAETHCRGRLVSLLEGGYHLEELANSVCHHVRALHETDAHDVAPRASTQMKT